MKKAQTCDPADVRESILATGQRLMAGKGYSAVGLTEILAQAGVPKGSFYHYFGSKDAFGEAVLDNYFVDYLAGIDMALHRHGMTMAQRVLQFFRAWQQNQASFDCQGKCLAVKMAAEVADMSEPMRLAIQRGNAGILSRLATALATGMAEGSLAFDGDAVSTAHSLYQLWLGASVMVKIERHTQPFDIAMGTTQRLLHLSPSEVRKNSDE
jgi:TetR/AcrR family transcriptional repressor of nem operon